VRGGIASTVVARFERRGRSGRAPARAPGRARRGARRSSSGVSRRSR
jgi:hypothetical protein